MSRSADAGATLPRADENESADVIQRACVRQAFLQRGDTCPRAGDLDQNIYCDLTP